MRRIVHVCVNDLNSMGDTVVNDGQDVMVARLAKKPGDGVGTGVGQGDGVVVPAGLVARGIIRNFTGD